jgi:hypothetical protein
MRTFTFNPALDDVTNICPVGIPTGEPFYWLILCEPYRDKVIKMLEPVMPLIVLCEEITDGGSGCFCFWWKRPDLYLRQAELYIRSIADKLIDPELGIGERRQDLTNPRKEVKAKFAQLRKRKRAEQKEAKAKFAQLRKRMRAEREEVKAVYERAKALNELESEQWTGW